MTTVSTVSLTPDTLIATEGETFAWNFSLSEPAPAGGLSLFLPVTVNNDPAPGDVEFFIDGSSNISDFEFVIEDDVAVGFNLTIAEGATEATLVSEAVADNIAEIDEIATIVLADGENYRANPAQNQVNLVLTDWPVVSLLPEEITVSEALDQLRVQAPDSETIYYIYILDEGRRLDGIVSLRELIQAKRAATLSEIMHRDVSRQTTKTKGNKKHGRNRKSEQYHEW